MSRERFVLYILLGLILAAVAGVSVVIMADRHPEKLSLPQNSFLFSSARSSNASTEPSYDFTAMLPQTSAAPAQTDMSADFSQTAPAAAASQFVAPNTEMIAPRGLAYTSVNRPAERFSSSAVKSLPAANGAAGTQTSKPGPIAAGTYSSSGPSFSIAVQDTPDPYAPAGSEMLESYTPAQTVAQQKALASKLANLSSGVERAIFQAMHPKSKREQNLEKYMPRQEQAELADSSAQRVKPASAAQTVGEQLSSQARQVVSDMRRTYGDKAAAKAGEIMNDFQQEMAGVLSNNTAPEEKMVQAQEVNNKYNAKLQRLNQQAARSKMEEQFRQENEQKLAKIRGTFGENTETAVRAKMEEYLQKRLELTNGGYSEEEYYKRYLELEEQQRKDVEQIIVQQNPNDLTVSSKLRALENAHAAEQLAQETQNVKEGKKTAKQFHLNEQTVSVYQEQWKQENQQIMQGMQTYGQQAQAQAQQVLQQVNEQRRQILREGGDALTVQRKMQQATEQANAELGKIRENAKPQFVENVTRKLDERNAEVLQQITAQMKDVPDELKARWSQQAEPILRKYNVEAAKVLANVEQNANYEQELKRLDEQKMKELQQISITAQ